MPIRKNTTHLIKDNKSKKGKDLCTKKGYKKCPFCGEEIKKQAIKCQYCKKFLNKIKKECPFCFNEIDANSLKCPFCEEFLELSDDINEVTENYVSLSELCRDVKEDEGEDDGEENNEENDEEEDEENDEEEDEENEEDGNEKKYRCGACKGGVSASDKVCPHCGELFEEDEDKYIARDSFAIIILFIIGAFIVGAIIGFFIGN